MFRLTAAHVVLLAAFPGVALSAQTPQPGYPNQPSANVAASSPTAGELAEMSMAPPAFVPNLQAPASPGAAANGPVRISGAVMAWQVVSRMDPVYPPDAKSAGVQGSVVLSASIAKDGTVQDLKVVSGPQALANAAVDAVRQWTYRPYLLNGQPTEVRTTITVNFHLQPPPAPASPQ